MVLFITYIILSWLFNYSVSINDNMMIVEFGAVGGIKIRR
jgi:hypothetical protein